MKSNFIFVHYVGAWWEKKEEKNDVVYITTTNLHVFTFYQHAAGFFELRLAPCTAYFCVPLKGEETKSLSPLFDV